MKRTMGLDVGDATVGIALSDLLGITSQGYENYRRVSVKADVDHLLEIVLDQEVDRIVVGLPLNMNGSKGPQAEKVEQFIKQLSKKLKYSDRLVDPVEIEYLDERLTTVQAEKVMIAADLSRAKRKSIIDKMAAQIILQSYLDGKGNRL